MLFLYQWILDKPPPRENPRYTSPAPKYKFFTTFLQFSRRSKNLYKKKHLFKPHKISKNETLDTRGVGTDYFRYHFDLPILASKSNVYPIKI